VLLLSTARIDLFIISKKAIDDITGIPPGDTARIP